MPGIVIVCSQCGEQKERYAKGLCRQCYKKGYVGRTIICSDCGEAKPHHAHGLCNPCYMKGYSIKYSVGHREGIRACTRRYHEKNNREYDRRYRKEHPESSRAAVRKWKETHPDAARNLARVAGVNRRARNRSLPNTLTSKEARVIMGEGVCFYCGGIEPPFELDHCIPLSGGGGTTKDNMVCACRWCNQQKGTRSAEEFMGMLAAGLFPRLVTQGQGV